MLEREAELERIDAALAAARGGEGVVLVIEGAPGVGKTALVAAAAARARRERMGAAVARGSELESAFAYGIVRQLLEQPVAKAGGRLLRGAAGLARPLFAGSAFEPPPDQAFAVQHGLYWVCANLAQERPVLLAVDDAHWADDASLRLLAYLAQRCDGLPLALLVATRPTDDPLVAALGPPALTPRALSLAAVAQLLEARLGRAPDVPFAAACHAATGGTPLLVGELARELDARAIAPVAAAAAEVAAVVPRGVARAVVARVQRLGPPAVAAARAAAVLGGDADPRRIGRLAGTAAAATLDALAAAGVLRAGRPVEFTHPILRSAVADALPAGQRSHLHAAAARLLREDGAPDERVAGHLLAVDPAGDEEAVAVLLRTARTALAQGAPGSAVTYLERALAEPPADRGAVLAALGVAEIHAGVPAAAARHLDQAAALSPADAAVARARIAALGVQGRYEDAAAVADALLARGGADPSQLRAVHGDRVTMCRLEPSLPPPPAAPPGPPTRAHLAAGCIEAVLDLRPPQEVERRAQAARRAGIVEELASGAIAWSQVAHSLLLIDAFAAAERLVDEALAALDRRWSAIGVARAYMARAALHLCRGSLREALADGRLAVDTGRRTAFSGGPYGVAVLVDALVAHGDLDAAERELARAELHAEVPDTFLHNRSLDARGRLRIAQGRPEEAVADLREAAARARRRGQSAPTLTAHRSALALALLRVGRDDEARAVAEEELAAARRAGAPRALGIALRAAGLAAGDDRGLALLRESVATLEGSGAALEHASSLVELGAALRRAGRRADAREPLHAGMERAHACAAAPLVRRAREELLAAGARPRRVVRSGVDALTPSELRVARLAAGGRSNRDIAQELFVTIRTVETHLSSAFRKLGVASRADLGPRLGD